jgi:CRISPR system Cascade subunit CasB
MEKPTEKTAIQKLQEKLFEFLRSRRDDRGLMADMRCVLVDGKRHRAWPYLGRFGGIGDTHLARTVQTVAGLYATHPEETSEGDFGALCRALLGEEERKQLATAAGVGPISRRFQHLLAAEDEEIFDRIIRLVLRAKAEDIPVNYQRLFEDLLNWQYRTERVRTEWARGFWAPMTEPEEAS